MILNKLLGYPMRTLSGIVCALALMGCGVEVATTAATSAAIKKQEIEAAKQTKDMVDKKIEAATQAMQQRTEQQEKESK
jgi:NifU-like protein involved in Fe-S cluster formation